MHDVLLLHVDWGEGRIGETFNTFRILFVVPSYVQVIPLLCHRLYFTLSLTQNDNIFCSSYYFSSTLRSKMRRASMPGACHVNSLPY
jgi:hypothetical protein